MEMTIPIHIAYIVKHITFGTEDLCADDSYETSIDAEMYTGAFWLFDLGDEA